MSLSKAIIKKSLKRVDSDCVSAGVLASSGCFAKLRASFKWNSKIASSEPLVLTITWFHNRPVYNRFCILIGGQRSFCLIIV